MYLHIAGGGLTNMSISFCQRYQLMIWHGLFSSRHEASGQCQKRAKLPLGRSESEAGLHMCVCVCVQYKYIYTA